MKEGQKPVKFDDWFDSWMRSGKEPVDLLVEVALTVREAVVQYPRGSCAHPVSSSSPHPPIFIPSLLLVFIRRFGWIRPR